MPELKPKNPLTQGFIDKHYAGQSFTTSPAFRQYVGKFSVFPDQYTEDPEAVGIVGPAVKVTFEDGHTIFLDTDEVIV